MEKASKDDDELVTMKQVVSPKVDIRSGANSGMIYKKVQPFHPLVPNLDLCNQIDT